MPSGSSLAHLTREGKKNTVGWEGSLSPQGSPQRHGSPSPFRQKGTEPTSSGQRPQAEPKKERSLLGAQRWRRHLSARRTSP